VKVKVKMKKEINKKKNVVVGGCDTVLYTVHHSLKKKLSVL